MFVDICFKVQIFTNESRRIQVKSKFFLSPIKKGNNNRSLLDKLNCLKTSNNVKAYLCFYTLFFSQTDEQPVLTVFTNKEQF